MIWPGSVAGLELALAKLKEMAAGNLAHSFSYKELQVRSSGRFQFTGRRYSVNCNEAVLHLHFATSPPEQSREMDAHFIEVTETEFVFWWQFWWQLDWQFLAKRSASGLIEILIRD